MNILRTFGSVCALGIGLAACVESPTAANAGGHTVGSGNLREAGSISASRALSGRLTGAASESAWPSLPGEPAADSVRVRTGHTVGSGN